MTMNKIDAFASTAARSSLSSEMAIGKSLQSLADEWEADPSARARGGETIRGLFSEQGIDVPNEVELRVVEDTRDVHHVIMPPDPNAALSDEALRGVSGGNCVGSAGTASTVGTFVSCIGSAGTASSASTAE